MIKSKNDWIIAPFFRWYIRRIVDRSFHRVEQCGTLKSSNKSILLLANHVSWWDGFWARHLNDTFFHRQFHAMMLEDQLRKHWYLKYCGGFSVQKKSRSILESLNHAADLLMHPNNLVLIFPQGKIGSQQQWTIHFERGVERILDCVDAEMVQVVFMVSLTDYFAHKKPVLTLFMEEYVGSTKTLEMETAFQNFYQRCQQLQSQKEV